MKIEIGTKWVTRPVEPTEVEVIRNKGGIIVSKCLNTGEVYSVSSIGHFEKDFMPAEVAK
ncbi:hypothetical protein PSYG_00029 [Psychrobacter phage pOW20-A]|uniref:hypothetical protein n=1 Tax=Psychrobacter phage pOW20-A TaxID=754048 RepID=UPI0002C18B63|nr:hypothetical protein PSYG_00029 [Psychrobacter phage pOW20-A]AGH57490.1 hypothetical protein PSYG_00029 [Psychrobacter phage pOW20-A]